VFFIFLGGVFFVCLIFKWIYGIVWDF